MKKMLKIFKKVFDVLCWALIALLVITVIMSVIANIKGTQPSVFGYSIYRVSSGSMSPKLEVGDVILGKSVDDPTQIGVGDIVTYKGGGELEGKLITHEVIVAPHEENGEIMLQTKGVANEIADSPINAERVVSVVICEVEFLAGFYKYFFSPWGLLTVIALIILVFIDELIVFIKTMTGNASKPESKNINDIISRMQSENNALESDSTDLLNQEDEKPEG